MMVRHSKKSQNKIFANPPVLKVTDQQKNGCAEPQMPVEFVGGSNAGGRRERGERRRMIDPTTCERDYNNDEIQFIMAMGQYKQDNCRPFPTWSEALQVLCALGYRKVAEPTKMPGLSTSMPPKAEE